MDNTEAIPHAAGESVESIRDGSVELEQFSGDCDGARSPSSTSVINTLPEQLFHQALKRAKLSFETQSNPGGLRWEANIELLQKKIVIEVTNSPGEKRAAARRTAKIQDLESLGYSVYYFSNHAARTNADDCVLRVMNDHDLHPEDDPEFNIRVNRRGQTKEHNPNWGGGKRTAPCEQCGSQVSSHKRNGGKEARFCSSGCYGNWMHEHPESINNKRQMPEMTDLAERYNSGISAKQVADSYGVSRSYVMTQMRKRGIPLRPSGGPRITGGFHQNGNISSS